MEIEIGCVNILPNCQRTAQMSQIKKFSMENSFCQSLSFKLNMN